MAGKVGKISLGPSPTGGTSFLILALWRPLSGCSARIGARSSADLKEFQLAESSRCVARSGWQIPFFTPCSERPWGKSHKAGLPLSQCVQRRHLHWGGSPAPPLPSQPAAETGPSPLLKDTRVRGVAPYSVKRGTAGKPPLSWERGLHSGNLFCCCSSYTAALGAESPSSIVLLLKDSN